MGTVMKRKVTKIVSLLSALTLLFAFNSMAAFAKEYNVTENFTIGDIEISVPDTVDMMTDNVSIDKESVVKSNSDRIAEYIANEIRFAAPQNDVEQSSTIYYGSDSGYLAQTNDYLLYFVNLTPGDYLQARLKLPNNAQIDYDLLLFDSSLSLIKSSDYVTCTDGSGTLDESIGYLASVDEEVYICVYSVGGGSQTEAYTLDYSITTDFSDSSEPDENAKEAKTLNIGGAGANVTGNLNSPIDNDWYSFTVLDSPQYDKIRLSIDSSSDTNGCNIEIYQNLVSDYYGMLCIGSGKGGEVELPAGTYYLRIVSTNTFSNFNAGDIPVYHLSVVPVCKADKVSITYYDLPLDKVEYNNMGKYYRLDQRISNLLVVHGRATYTASDLTERAAANVKISGVVLDEQWAAINRPDMEKVYGTAVTDRDGNFTMKIYLKTALGGLSDNIEGFTHCYDFMKLTLSLANNENIKVDDHFYYLKFSYR